MDKTYTRQMMLACPRCGLVEPVTISVALSDVSQSRIGPRFKLTSYCPACYKEYKDHADMLPVDPELADILCELWSMNFITLGHCSRIHNGIAARLDWAASPDWLQGPFIAIGNLTPQEYSLFVDAAVIYNHPFRIEQNIRNTASSNIHDNVTFIVGLVKGKEDSIAPDDLLKANAALTSMLNCWLELIRTEGIERTNRDTFLHEFDSTGVSWFYDDNGKDICEAYKNCKE